MCLGAARGDVLGERLRVVLVEAVGGDGARVHESLRLRRDCRLEDVARALEVDLPALAGARDDDEREVHDDVGLGAQRFDGGAVEHVALPVLGLVPLVLLGVERTARHPEDARDVLLALERADERLADLACRTRNGDGEAHVRPRLASSRLAVLR